MKDKRGFTLVELLAVLIVLSVISIIVYPILNKTLKDNRKKVFKESLNGIIRAAELYKADNGNRLPGKVRHSDPNLKIDHKDQWLSGYVYEKEMPDGTTKLKVRNFSNGEFCGSGYANEFVVEEGECTFGDTPDECFIFSNGVIEGYNLIEGCPLAIEIPTKINGKDVLYISEYAFEDIPVQKVFISSSIKEIGEGAFEDTGLEILDFSEATSLEEIGDYAFAFNYLSDIDFSNLKSLKGIGECAFCESNLSGTVNLSSSKNLQYINDAAFEDNSIEKVNLSGLSKLEAIGYFAFDINEISDLSMDGTDGLVYLGGGAFNSNKLPESKAYFYGKSENESNTNPLTTLVSYGGYSENITIPSSVTEIGESAFEDDLSIKNVDLTGSSVKYIDAFAFSYTTNLTSVKLNNGLLEIGDHAFYYSSLSEITIPSSVTEISNRAFISNNTWTSVIINSDATNLESRFNASWSKIGWPNNLKPANPPITFVLGADGGLFQYAEAYYNVSVSKAGNYKIEVWGGNSAVKGGYSTGIVTLTTSDVLYVYPGGSSANGGFNGGGEAGTTTNSAAQNGAGASDVRVNGKTLYDRVIVAGGAGGKATNSCGTGQTGGGITGAGGASQGNCGTSAGGGTISSGGIGGLYRSTSGKSGVFGAGGSSNSGQYVGGGGGGGWYGGGGGATAGWSNGGGGGSGWVYTSDNYASWNSANPTDASKYNLTSKYYLTSALTVRSTETGYVENPKTDGNGYVRITFVS